MNIINKFTKSNLKKNKKRTIVTTIGVALSTALICAVAGMIMSFQNTLVEYAKKEYGNYHACYMNIPNNQIKYIKDNVQVESSFYSKTLGYAKLEGSKNEDKPYVYVIGMDDIALKENGFTITKGRMPENDTELVISRHIEYNGRVYLDIGDTITLDIGTRQDGTGYILDQSNPYRTWVDYSGDGDGEKQATYEELQTEESIVNTTKKTYKIVGIIERPNMNIEDYRAPGYTVLTYMTDEQILNSSSLQDSYGTNVSILLKKPTESRETLKGISRVLKENTGKSYEVLKNDSLLESQGGLSDNSLQVVYTLRSYNNWNNNSK